MSSATTLDDIAESIADLTSMFATEVTTLRQEMYEGFSAVRKEMSNEFASVRQEMATKQDLLRVENELRHELRQIDQRLEKIEGKTVAHERDIRELYFMIKEEPISGTSSVSASKPKLKRRP